MGYEVALRLKHTNGGSTMQKPALWSAAVGLAVICVTYVGAKDAKLKPEELVEKHVASIGEPAARSGVQSRLVSGTSTAVFRLGGHGNLQGKNNILSEGHKIRIGMIFPALEYPGEQLAFDGEKVTVGQVRPGERSSLSAFVYQYDGLLKEGLLGGAMTTAWALLEFAERKPRLNYSGLKKLEGLELHELKYRPRKGIGDLQISLYFEPESFRHVRTQYRLVQPAWMASTPAESSGQRDTLYTLVEQFGDFKEVDSLTLPHSYKLVLTIEGQRNTILSEWNIAAEQVSHNQQIDPKYFRIWQ
jgi:hypothetical protein